MMTTPNPAFPSLVIVGPNRGVYAVRFGEHAYRGRVEDPPSVRLAAWLGLVGLDLVDLVRALPAQEGAEEAPKTARWWRRGLREPRGEPSECPTESLAETILGVIRGPAERPEEVVEWEDRDAAAVLDVDDPSSVDEIRLVPEPAARWRSHGGGLHALYAATAGFPARELAAAAGLLVARQDPRAGVEVLARTRHPGGLRGGKTAGPVLLGVTDPFRLAATLRGESGIADEAEVEAWLETRGLERGRRYGHDRCPGDPSATTGQPPVVVGDDGIVCHRCRSSGRGGWWPWGRLLGVEGSRGPWAWLAEAARGLALQDHAEAVLAEATPGFPAALRSDAYRALCRAAHDPEDPRIPGLWRRRLVRGDGLWLDAETLAPVLPQVGREVTQGMPSARFATRLPDGSWEDGVDPVRHDRHRTDQRVDGYVPVRPVRGIRLWGRHRPYPGAEALRITVDAAVPHPPRYVPPEARPQVADAEAALLGQLPGLRLDYLRLLLLGRAYAERGDGPVPMILATGVTGAGKTMTALLAAAAVGDRVESVRFDDPGRFAEAIGVGSQQAGFLLADEFAKGLKWRQRQEAFGRWLDVRRQYTYRRLRVGPVTVSLDSLIIVADTDVGEEIAGYAQVARRFVHVHLYRRVPQEWTRALRTGSVEIARDDAEVAAALDVVLSDLVDRWLPPGESGPDWWAAARSLGFRRLEEEVAATADGVSVETLVRELWDASKEVSEAGEPWKGGGWKMFDPAVEQGSRLYEAWVALCDGAHPDQVQKIRRAREVDLGAALGVDAPVALDVAPHRGRIGFRWRRADTGEALTELPEAVEEEHYEGRDDA